MVNFSCDNCGDIIKKPKLENHLRSCRASTVSCLDCKKIFKVAARDFQTHTQCISEAEKYQKALYKPPKKQNTPQKQQTPTKEASPQKPSQNGESNSAKKRKLEETPAPEPVTKETNTSDWSTLSKKMDITVSIPWKRVIRRAFKESNSMTEDELRVKLEEKAIALFSQQIKNLIQQQFSQDGFPIKWNDNGEVKLV